MRWWALFMCGCTSLGYVRTEFKGARESIQACQVDARRESMTCVDMTSFQLEFNKHLQSLTPDEKQALLFERDWNEGEHCSPTSYGEVCVP